MRQLYVNEENVKLGHDLPKIFGPKKKKKKDKKRKEKKSLKKRDQKIQQTKEPSPS